ncbi:MAG TPA: biotin--[acetyl-CoA-carboxylase] ligase [Terriglobia bacterium]|nr:biotin--[acetyl-CoA-carboxylase] ligase [Terriglobia bacterium]
MTGQVNKQTSDRTGKKLAQPTDRRIDKLIHLLVENATVIVPGPKIADEIGVTRGTVWMWVEKLRSQGVEIRGLAGGGYRLQKLPDVLTPSLVSSALGDCEMGRKIIHYFLVGSTNTLALRMASDGAPHGTVVVAEEQSAGRGRFGRTWHSEKSAGIYASIILRPPLAPSAAPILTLMAGLAVHRATADITGLAPDIRWPNDLLLSGKKIGGILTEMNAELDRVHAIVVGIGLNVNHQEMPDEIRPVATSMRIAGGKVYSRVQLLAGVLRQLQNFYRILLGQGSGVIARAWEQESTFARGKRVRVKTDDGESLAITDGLESNGALRLKFDDGRTVALVSGEVIEIK